jgi:hypothetical protein
MSFQSILKPSIRIGVSPLAKMRELKCLMILWKGSSSPSSGAMSFSLMDAM